MPTIDQLFQFEDQLEAAWESIFAAASFTAYKQCDIDNAVTPFCTIQARIGEVLSYHPFSESKVLPVAWRCSFSFKIFTNRNTNAASHITYRGKIRRICYQFDTLITAGNLPWHIIKEMTETGSSAQIQAAENHDISEINFASCFEIREDYWNLLNV